ncbi:ATP-binding cassette domain-containing protein [Frankia sp. CNm7]|uniref:ATP-binding cassette domain-containing protein n=1 Tax=Frankia nepalensis TaxID=1836974 RepID=A0A937RTC3_9ACTN|nr:branched-chain amino acid ABC transporter permease/ATP-binding protein [Frankia nepalensis]MBL7501243.1 ATP-binding cassette domain-containing protein [Frankia nepalensis]MBL7509441.1 ATP-binding cassette domain-containing protein [Frankia nepalensis]MBL7523347.1 ATP-binding cassette domain-containing protein [Frankia nepalensis]MBL7631556.1 ATP-binding cassette domain-containing protein [Frankia nepalensis]
MSHIGSLLLGLGNGAVFAALALALVLTYRSSGVINFATGAIALYVAYTYADLRNGELLVPIPGLPRTVGLGTDSLPFLPAALIALLIGALLGALLYVAVFRQLLDAPPLAKAVASLAVLIVIQQVMVMRVGVAPVSVEAIFPDERWTAGDLVVLSDRFYLAVSVIVLTLVLTAIFRFTRFGLLTRATASSQTGAYVSGVSANRVALSNWMISCAVAGAAGILIAPVSPLAPTTYTLFVVPALAAAVVGGFQNLVPAVAAGLAIGMLQAEALSLAAEHSWLPRTGSAELVPLIVIIIALLVTGRAMPVRGGLMRQSLGQAPRARRLTMPTVLGTAIGVIALVATTGTMRSAVIGTFIAAIIGLSLVVVTGYAGQVSLAQLALAGAGAFLLSFVTESWNIPFPLAPIVAALGATVLGVLIGLPALRLRGLTLGIVTLALAYAIEAVWFRNTQIVSTEGARVTQPKLFGLDLSIGTGHAFPRIEFGLMVLVVLVAVAWGVAKLRMSALGSAMLAVRANEQSAAGIGINVVKIKVISFALASFIAGLGGSMLAYRRGVVTFDSFTAIGGLALLTVAYLAGVTSVWGGLNAGLMAATGFLFYAIDRWVVQGGWFQVITGLLLLLTIITKPEGIASDGHKLADKINSVIEKRRPKKVPVPAQAPAAGGTSDRPAPAAATGRTAALEVSGLSVRYGGVVAVNDVALRVEPGKIVGLIGPNGAGKTSALDAITGFARATGEVAYGGTRLDGLPPHARVHRGLARTFQSLELYEELTVEENVSAALATVRGAERHRRLHEALELTGITDRAHRRAGELSQGERQLVSIARACANNPGILLLDEPAAGLDSTESAWLGERIRGIAATGTGVLLVDHDVALVLGICDHIYVLEFGKLIAEGDPASIRANREVADAYLGNAHHTGDDAAVAAGAVAANGTTANGSATLTESAQDTPAVTT